MEFVGIVRFIVYWLCAEWCRRMLDSAVRITDTVSGSYIRAICRRVIKTLHLDRTSTLLV